MRIEDLEVFLEVIQSGTFSAAALELGASQPTVSHVVQRLEDELGLRLFDRGREGAGLTEAGRDLEVHARAVLQAHAAMTQQAAVLNGGLHGRVAVAAYPSTASTELPEVLALLQRTHPELQIDLMVVDGNAANARALRARKVDAAFFINSAPDELIAWEVYRESYAAFVLGGEGLPGTAGAKELRSWPLVLHRDNECTVAVDRYLESIGVPVKPLVRLRDRSSQLGMVARGVGVALLAASTVSDVPEGVRKVDLETPMERSFLVAIQPEGLRSPGVKAFLGALKSLHPESAVPSFPIAPSGD